MVEYHFTVLLYTVYFQFVNFMFGLHIPNIDYKIISDVQFNSFHGGSLFSFSFYPSKLIWFRKTHL